MKANYKKKAPITITQEEYEEAVKAEERRVNFGSQKSVLGDCLEILKKE